MAVSLSNKSNPPHESCFEELRRTSGPHLSESTRAKATMVSTTLVGTAILALLAAYKLAPSRFQSIQEGDAILVTGSHSGIGRHAALSLAREGFVVFACVRKLQHGDELLQEVAAHDDIDASKLKPILLDVTQPEQIAEAVETVSEFVGDMGLYGLFNNAGIGTSAAGTNTPDVRSELLWIAADDQGVFAIATTSTRSYS